MIFGELQGCCLGGTSQNISPFSMCLFWGGFTAGSEGCPPSALIRTRFDNFGEVNFKCLTTVKLRKWMYFSLRCKIMQHQ